MTGRDDEVPLDDAPDVNDFSNVVGMMNELRNTIVAVQKRIETAVNGVAGKEQVMTSEVVTKRLEQAIATIQRLEDRPQLDIEGRLEDLQHQLRTPAPTRQPWWVWSAALTLVAVLGIGVGWATKPRLFLSPVPQVIQQVPCPEAPRKGR